jgi:hypothetical protein
VRSEAEAPRRLKPAPHARKMKAIAVFALVAPGIFAQGAPKPYQGQSASTFSVTGKDTDRTIEISNVAYEVTGTGNPLLVLRKSTRTKEVVGDIGKDGTTTVEAWALGTDFRQKPLYVLKIEGIDPVVVDSEVIQISRGLEEVEWWSIYKLANGEHLFDTYTPLTKFSISRETLTPRYVGLEVPPDDVKDARLRDSHVVAVVSYASAAKVIREALITADDPKQAQLLRSFADCSRTVEGVERDGVVRSLRVTVRQNFTSAPNPVMVTIPLSGDDLDPAHAQLPPRLHVAAWKR